MCPARSYISTPRPPQPDPGDSLRELLGFYEESGDERCVILHFKYAREGRPRVLDESAALLFGGALFVLDQVDCLPEVLIDDDIGIALERIGRPAPFVSIETPTQEDFVELRRQQGVGFIDEAVQAFDCFFSILVGGSRIGEGILPDRIVRRLARGKPPCPPSATMRHLEVFC